MKPVKMSLIPLCLNEPAGTCILEVSAEARSTLGFHPYTRFWWETLCVGTEVRCES